MVQDDKAGRKARQDGGAEEGKAIGRDDKEEGRQDAKQASRNRKCWKVNREVKEEDVTRRQTREKDTYYCHFPRQLARVSGFVRSNGRELLNYPENFVE